jgi:hypothetical protein
MESMHDTHAHNHKDMSDINTGIASGPEPPHPVATMLTVIRDFSQSVTRHWESRGKPHTRGTRLSDEHVDSEGSTSSLCGN